MAQWIHGTHSRFHFPRSHAAENFSVLVRSSIVSPYLIQKSALEARIWYSFWSEWNSFRIHCRSLLVFLFDLPRSLRFLLALLRVITGGHPHSCCEKFTKKRNVRLNLSAISSLILNRRIYTRCRMSALVISRKACELQKFVPLLSSKNFFPFGIKACGFKKFGPYCFPLLEPSAEAISVLPFLFLAFQK